ncbi:MAG: extracellular solute-binding protein [bacterium]|nr:extracellular solute-binding protein [bacterium]
MMLKWAINLSLISIVVFLSVFPTFAEEKSLTLWLMPNEPPIPYQPSDNEIKEFLVKNPNVKNTISELKSDDGFAKAVLGQRKILELLRKYKAEKRFEGQINLRILKWPEAFGEIDDADYAYKERFSPDIVQLGTTWNAYFAHKGALVEITDYVDERLYFEPSIKSCKILGSEKIYGLPLNVDIRVLYYWKSLVNNPELELRDWGSFKTTCSRIQELIKDEKAPAGMRWAIGFPVCLGEWDMLHQFAVWIWSAGGEIVDIKKVCGIFSVKKGGFDSKETLGSAVFLKELTTEIKTPQFTLGELETMFIDGEIGMLISGGWLVKRLQDRFGEEA